MNILALDIGGTSIKSGLYHNNKIQNLIEAKTDAKLGGPFVMEKVKEIIRNYSSYEKIAISTAGQVDSSNGVISYANSNIPNYTGMPVKKILEEEFSVPVYVENDGYCAALGEAWHGAGQEFKNFLCLTYGTGVGGAIIINGNIYKGQSLMAGEFGGILIHPEAQVENDPLSGCYEKYASTTALVENAMELNLDLSDGRKIFSEIEDMEVRRVINNWVDEISFGLVSLIHIFNPEAVVLGGGVLSQEYVINRLNHVLSKRLISNFRNTKIKNATLGNSAGLYGAVSIAIKDQ